MEIYISFFFFENLIQKTQKELIKKNITISNNVPSIMTKRRATLTKNNLNIIIEKRQSEVFSPRMLKSKLKGKLEFNFVLQK